MNLSFVSRDDMALTLEVGLVVSAQVYVSESVGFVYAGGRQLDLTIGSETIGVYSADETTLPRALKVDGQVSPLPSEV